MHRSCPSLHGSIPGKMIVPLDSGSRAPMASTLFSASSAVSTPAGTPQPFTQQSLAQRFEAVRAQTERLCEPLDTEDYVVSSMADVSPTKWHLAHTSWFFETFILATHSPEYTSPNPRYAFLFNSYYVQAGERHCRAKRGTRHSTHRARGLRVSSTRERSDARAAPSRQRRSATSRAMRSSSSGCITSSSTRSSSSPTSSTCSG